MSTEQANGDSVQQLEPAKKKMSTSRTFSRSSIVKLVVVALVVLIIAAIAAVCAVVFVPRAGADTSIHGGETMDMGTLMKREAMFSKLVERASIQRRPMKSQQTNREQSCYSLMTNDSYPAAHITGINEVWDVVNRSPPSNLDASDANAYQSHWMCTKKRGAFVDGGMYFNQTDKKLYVPKCGYYYVSSQMYFGYKPTDGQKYVRHLLTVDRNCGPDVNDLHLESYSSLGNINKSSSTSTYLADIVKICEGGKISVTVKNRTVTPCCAGGRDTVTFISAHLVSESECGMSLDEERRKDHIPTQKDYDDYYDKKYNQSQS